MMAGTRREAITRIVLLVGLVPFVGAALLRAEEPKPLPAELKVLQRFLGDWESVTTTKPEADDLRRLVVESHELLADVPGPVGREFRCVVEELRRDQQKTTRIPSA